jgi:hypothetical protein
MFIRKPTINEAKEITIETLTGITLTILSISFTTCAGIEEFL